MKEKQIVIVLSALTNGHHTSVEISAVTGIPLRHCSAYLNELRKAGLAEFWPGCRSISGRPGAPARFWQAIKA